MIGSGGLLGSAIARRTVDRFDAGNITWHDPEAAAQRLRAAARAFCEIAADDEWSVIWAAGAATTSTNVDEAEKESIPLMGLLEGLRSAMPVGPGAFFLTSSAGGIYAGSSTPPFTERTIPEPLSAYGHLKIRQEQLAREYLDTLCPVAVGRISNIYGPGQNLDKLQGLISRLALAAATRQPINIFVSLDTIRDYVFVDDAAEAVLCAVARARSSKASHTEVIASGQPVTVGQLIRTVDQVTKRRVPVALGVHASSASQANDLRLIPTFEPANSTTLHSGVKSVHMDVVERIQNSRLRA